MAQCCHVAVLQSCTHATCTCHHLASEQLCFLLPQVLALVKFYAREGYAKQLQTVCTEVLKKKPNDPLLVFWRAVGLLLEGASTEVGVAWDAQEACTGLQQRRSTCASAVTHVQSLRLTCHVRDATHCRPVAAESSVLTGK